MFPSQITKLTIYFISLSLFAGLTFDVLASFHPEPGSSSRVLASEHPAEHGAHEKSAAPKTGHHHHQPNSMKIALFVFISMIVASFIREIKKNFKIPYTPMLMVFGMAAGYFSEHLSLFGHAVDLVNTIDPHTLLMIFIPGLVFESAYNTDGHVILKSKWQILILAGPGVLITAVLIALSLLYIFNYQAKLTLPEALVIGSILSTTDPVAVVALLKELGTSTKFNTLLEGESLLNDGTGFVFFLICLDVAIKGSFSMVSSTIMFVQLTLGGVAFGYAIGFVAANWIKRILKDHSLVIMITVFCAYMIFYIAEQYLHVSGIISLVTFGVYLSNTARMSLKHEIDHSVHTVWSFTAFLLETLIFILNGTFIGDKIKELDQLSLETSDIWKVLLFFPFLNILRFVVLVI